MYRGASTSFSPGAEFWKSLWNAKLAQPKMVHFLWKVIQNATPLRENLFSVSCYQSPLCQICSLEIESSEHIIFRCDWVLDVWVKCGFSKRISSNYTSTTLWAESLWRSCKIET